MFNIDDCILDYGEGKRLPLPDTNIHDINVGFELEILPINDRDHLAAKILDLQYFICEEDGSLPDYEGFEIISHYGSLNRVLKLASDLVKELDGEVYDNVRDEYGLHIHVSNRKCEYTNAKMVVLWNDEENRQFITDIAKRDCTSDYFYANPSLSKARLKSTRSASMIDMYPDSRYSIVNINNNTVEVRAFKSRIDEIELLACIELAYYSYEYCSLSNVHADNLNWIQFLEWIGANNKAPNLKKFRLRNESLTVGV